MIEFKAHLRKSAFAVAFLPDNRFLLTSGGDRALRLWSLDDLKIIREWPGSNEWGPIACTHDGRYVALRGNGVQVWSIEGDARPIVDHGQPTGEVSFSPDGKVFVAHGTYGRPLRRWAIPSGEELPGGWSNEGWGEPPQLDRIEKQFPASGLAFHPDGAILAASFGVFAGKSFDAVIYFWDAATGALRGELRTLVNGHHASCLRYSPDGSLLACHFDNVLRVWQAESHRQVACLKLGRKSFQGLNFTPDGRRLVSVSNDETVRLWNTSDWTEAGSFTWGIGKLRDIAISRDGFRMAAAGNTGKVIVWDADSV